MPTALNIKVKKDATGCAAFLISNIDTPSSKLSPRFRESFWLDGA